MPGYAPGWYPDPQGRFAQRYYDGQQWTPQVQSADGRPHTDHIGGPPPQYFASAPLPPAKKGGCLKVGLILSAALVVLIVIVAVASGGGSDNDSASPRGENDAKGIAGSDNADGKHPNLFPDRPDRQKEDQERNVGGPEVAVSGYRTVVSQASFQQSVSEFETDGYLVAEVTIRNNDEGAQPYNYFDFKLQTPGGTVIDPDLFTTLEDTLASGDLVGNGEVTGKLVWTVKAEKGDFYVIYKPDPFDAARGIWKATI